MHFQVWGGFLLSKLFSRRGTTSFCWRKSTVILNLFLNLHSYRHLVLLGLPVTKFYFPHSWTVQLLVSLSDWLMINRPTIQPTVQLTDWLDWLIRNINKCWIHQCPSTLGTEFIIIKGLLGTEFINIQELSGTEFVNIQGLLGTEFINIQ